MMGESIWHFGVSIQLHDDIEDFDFVYKLILVEYAFSPQPTASFLFQCLRNDPETDEKIVVK